MAHRLHHISLPCELSAAEAFSRLRQREGCAWLDSSRSNPQADGRWSLLTAEPVARLRYRGRVLERISYRYLDPEPDARTAEPQSAEQQWRQHQQPQQRSQQQMPLQQCEVLDTDPLLALETMLAEYAGADSFGQPADEPTGSDDSAATAFCAPFFSSGGGAIGYLSYELGRQWEAHSPCQPVAEQPAGAFPQMDWAFYNHGLLLDHGSGKACVVACSAHSADEARQRAERFLQMLLHPVTPDTGCGAGSTANSRADIGTASSATGKAELEGEALTLPETVAQPGDSASRRAAYTQSVARVREYIAQGDIYQTNIAQYFTEPLLEHPAELYLRLRRLNPAPYAAYLDTGAYQVLSSSPELFLQKRGRRVRTRPIKGTRPRGKTAAQDEAMKRELLGSDKERSELLMIVDLERNDLGRVCQSGSVQVDALYRVETYATVHHLVADVSGTLAAGCGLGQLLRATFPGGSITGAPKVRSMQIIDELEQQERGIFCGAIGVLGFDGAADLNIAIRTLLCAPSGSGRVVHLGVGAGLVWDSEPQHEYEETLHKAQALLEAIRNQSSAGQAADTRHSG